MKTHGSGISVNINAHDGHGHSCPPGHDVLRVLDIPTRDAIPPHHRHEGLWVLVLEEMKFYRLTGGLTNDCWVACGDGHGGDISPDDLPIASKTEKGIVQIGDNITVDADGLIAVANATEDTAGVVELASVDEAKAGIDATKAVTPVGLAEALVTDKVDNPLPIASKTEKGIVQIGDNITVDADGLIAVANATEDTAGVVELASVDEAKAGIDATKAVTPVGLAEALKDKVTEVTNTIVQGFTTMETIKTSGPWISPKDGVIRVRVIGGGGSGSSNMMATAAGTAWPHESSGGGAGHITEAYVAVKKGQSTAVVVGAGGASVPWRDPDNLGQAGNSGFASRFGSISAGGGYGGSHSGGKGGGNGTRSRRGLCACGGYGGNNGTNVGNGGNGSTAGTAGGSAIYKDGTPSDVGSSGGVIIEY